MTEDGRMKVSEFRGVDIFYEPEKKQFVAKLEDHGEIRKAAQRDVEKEILKLLDPSARVKAILIESRHWHSDVTVETVEVLGRRNGKIQYLDKDGRRSHSRYGNDLFLFDARHLEEAKGLIKEHEAWCRKWEALLKRLKEIPEEGTAR